MSGRRSHSSNPSSNGEEHIECMANQLVQQFQHGDIVWSRINGGSWWPVQVADEKCVACKPKKIKNDEILVRLYGTLEHMYVEPVNCFLKIDKFFDQVNCSNREVFQKILEEDLTHMKSVGQSAATVTESKETAEIIEIEEEEDETPGGKWQSKGNLKRNMVTDNSPLARSSDNPKAAKQVKVGITKRWTRSETFKARNEGKSAIEGSTESGNLISWTSAVSSLDKKDSNYIKEKLTLKNPDVKKSSQIEYSDVKDIKKLVAKIVKEVAQKARNEALKSKGMGKFPENTEHNKNSSGKKTTEIKNKKGLVPRKLKNKDTEVHITGARDVEKPNGAVLSNGASFNNEIRGINGVHGSKSYLKEMKGDEKPQFNSAKQDEAMKPSETKEAINGRDQRDKVVKQGASRDEMDIPSTTKCFLSPRCTRVMRSLGLIAPLGSPFCRNGLIRSLLP